MSDSEYERLQRLKGDRTYRKMLSDALDVTLDERVIGRPKSTAFDPAKYEADARERYLKKLREDNAERAPEYEAAAKELGVDKDKGISYISHVVRSQKKRE